MKLSLVILSVLLGCCVCSKDKGYSTMPYYGGGGGGGYGGGYAQVSYAPVYKIHAVDAYPVQLPQYSFKNDFKTYMPVVKYIPVKSVPYYGPTQAFYPSYGGGYGGGMMGGGYGGGY